MLTQSVYESVVQRALKFLDRAGIVLSEAEKEQVQVAEYGMDMLDHIGLELVVYVNTERCCAKELVLFPGQTCPEHRHPPIGSYPGKEETFRCRWGSVYPAKKRRTPKALHHLGKVTVLPFGMKLS